MSEPQEVLSQLLSPPQAATLDATGRESWDSASAALKAALGSAPLFSEVAEKVELVLLHRDGRRSSSLRRSSGRSSRP